jgi:hypothetical protein
LLPLQWEVRGLLGAASGRLITPCFSLLSRTPVSLRRIVNPPAAL